MKKQVLLLLLTPLCFSLFSCGSETSEVKNYELGNGVLFDGVINNNTKKPADGNGKLTYKNNSTFEGEFLNGLPTNGLYNNKDEKTTFDGELTSNENYEISYKNGKLTYENGQYYLGKFENNLFEDENGFYSYHLVNDDVIEYSYTYEGGFHQGNVDNQIGKLTYPASFTNIQGIWYVEGEMESTCKVKPNQTVQCKIRWEAAYYEGDAFYDGINCVSQGKGTTVFDNTCNYVGEYKNGEYSGKGVFNWPDGTWFEGNFLNGSPHGQTGTIHYPCEKTKTSGVWNFTGKMVGFVAPEVDQVGIGKIRYDDLTFYEGEIYYNGGWKRLGHGEQNFLPANFAASYVGGPVNAIIDKYVGEFNEDKSGWIFGNGIYYFKDYSGKPIGWSHAYWYGLDAVDHWRGEFDESQLLEEYKDLEELPIKIKDERANHYNSMYKDTNKDILFIGDSYLEMWRREYNIVNYETDFEAVYDSMNLAIGGTTFKHWISHLFDKMVVSHTAKQIVVHLGTNDVHMHLELDTILKHSEQFVNMLKNVYPNAKIYLLNNEPTPTFRWSLETEKAYNKAIAEKYANDAQVTVIDTASRLMDGEQPVNNLWEYFISDGLHMNAKGYASWVQMIKNALGLE